MRISIETPEQIIAFVETLDLPIDKLNRILLHSCGAIFTDHHTPTERGRLLKIYFQQVQSMIEKFGAETERPLFIHAPILEVEN